MKARHRPQRSCVACRETTDQRDLVRLTHGDDGLVVDEARRSSGRGAYLCRRPACWGRARELARARAGGPLGRALRTAIDERDLAVLAAFEAALEAVPAETGMARRGSAGGRDPHLNESEGESGTA